MTTPHRRATALELTLTQHSLRNEKLEKNESLRAELEVLGSERERYNELLEYREEQSRKMSPGEIMIHLQAMILNISAAIEANATGDHDRTETLIHDALDDASELFSDLRSENPRTSRLGE